MPQNILILVSLLFVVVLIMYIMAPSPISIHDSK